MVELWWSMAVLAASTQPQNSAWPLHPLTPRDSADRPSAVPFRHEGCEPQSRGHGDPTLRQGRLVVEDERHEFVTDAAADITICGDQELLTQMLANLVENAPRRMPAGSRVRSRSRGCRAEAYA
jgi:hypothetical protein